MARLFSKACDYETFQGYIKINSKLLLFFLSFEIDIACIIHKKDYFVNLSIYYSRYVCIYFIRRSEKFQQTV